MRYLALLLLMTGAGLAVPPVTACDTNGVMVVTLTGTDSAAPDATAPAAGVRRVVVLTLTGPDGATTEVPVKERVSAGPFALANAAGPTVSVPDAVYDALDTRIYGVKIQGVSLQAAARSLEESVGRRLHIELGPGANADVKVTATFDGVPLGQALRLLAQSAGVTIQPVANTNAVRLVNAAATAEVRVERPGQPGVTTAEKTRTNPSAWSEEWGFVWPAVGYPSKRLPMPGQFKWTTEGGALALPMKESDAPLLWRTEAPLAAGDMSMHLQALEGAHMAMALSPEAMKEWKVAAGDWEAAMAEHAHAQALNAEAMQRISEEMKRAHEALARVRDRHEGMPDSQAAHEALERAMQEMARVHEELEARHLDIEKAVRAGALAGEVDAATRYRIETGPDGLFRAVPGPGVAAVSSDEIIYLPNAALTIDGKATGAVRVVIGRSSGRPYLETEGLLRILKALPAGVRVVAIEVDQEHNTVTVKTGKE